MNEWIYDSKVSLLILKFIYQKSPCTVSYYDRKSFSIFYSSLKALNSKIVSMFQIYYALKRRRHVMGPAHQLQLNLDNRQALVLFSIVFIFFVSSVPRIFLNLHEVWLKLDFIVFTNLEKWKYFLMHFLDNFMFI